MNEYREEAQTVEAEEADAEETETAIIDEAETDAVVDMDRYHVLPEPDLRVSSRGGTDSVGWTLVHLETPDTQSPVETPDNIYGPPATSNTPVSPTLECLVPVHRT